MNFDDVSELSRMLIFSLYSKFQTRNTINNININDKICFTSWLLYGRHVDVLVKPVRAIHSFFYKNLFYKNVQHEFLSHKML